MKYSKALVDPFINYFHLKSVGIFVKSRNLGRNDGKISTILIGNVPTKITTNSRPNSKVSVNKSQRFDLMYSQNGVTNHRNVYILFRRRRLVICWAFGFGARDALKYSDLFHLKKFVINFTIPYRVNTSM